MALLFCEGFEQYNSASDMTATNYQSDSPMPGRWVGSYGPGPIGITNTTYRTLQPGGASNSKALKFGDSIQQWPSGATLQFPTRNKIIFGFAIKFDSGGTPPIIRLTDSSGASTLGIRLVLGSDGSVKVVNAATSAELLTLPALTFTSGVWYYFELLSNLHASTGSIELRLDGISKGIVGSINTAGGLTYYSGLQIAYLGGSTPACYIDDIYICDDNLPNNTDFLGAINVYSLFPTANSSNQFTPSTAPNHSCVNKVNWTSDTKFVKATSINLSDWYEMQDIPGSPQYVYAVTVNNMSKKGDNGSRKIKNQIRLNSNQGNVLEDTAETQPVYNTYRWSQSIFATQPGGSPWTYATVNDLEAGIKSR